MEKLTEEILIHEYNDWLSNNGTGRDSMSIRFGQRMWSKYTWPNQVSESADGFYTEDPEMAYTEIMNQMKPGEKIEIPK